jgi:hypothetical protein
VKLHIYTLKKVGIINLPTLNSGIPAVPTQAIQSSMLGSIHVQCHAELSEQICLTQSSLTETWSLQCKAVIDGAMQDKLRT